MGFIESAHLGTASQAEPTVAALPEEHDGGGVHPLDLNPESHQIIPDLGYVLKLDAMNPRAVFFLRRRPRCPPGQVCQASQDRDRGEQPKIASCPFVIRLKGGEDFVCLCFKGNGANLYCYGLSVEDLMKWKFCRLLGAIPLALAGPDRHVRRW